MLDDIDLDKTSPTLGSNYAEKLTFHNVEISVRPEIILRGDGPKGKKLVGAIKLHFSKTRPHSEESAGYVSAVAQEYCRLHVATNNEIVTRNTALWSTSLQGRRSQESNQRRHD